LVVNPRRIYSIDTFTTIFNLIEMALNTYNRVSYQCILEADENLKRKYIAILTQYLLKGAQQ